LVNDLERLIMAMDLPQKYQQEMNRVPQGKLIRPSRKTNGAGVQAEDTKICVVMVGLPARGKSLIAQKGTFVIISSLNWHMKYSLLFCTLWLLF
jgi:hypothetical protein